MTVSTSVACARVLARWALLAAAAPGTLWAGEPGTTSASVLSVAAPAPRADFVGEALSADARQVTDWIARSGDARGADFIIVDKKAARLHVFDAAARLRGSTRILLGAARGDDSVPGIGARPMAQIRPEERTTPAGRFVAERGRNLRGEGVVWVDYDAAVSMHRVRATNAKERRLERLASPGIEDKRISYGCINVPAAFFDAHVWPAVTTRRTVIYVLPEVKSLQQVFGFEGKARG